MADTPIEWTNKSWNMIAAYHKGKRGWMCSKPSTGCKNCYSERINLRLGNGLRYTPENVEKVDLRLVNLDEPFRWRKPQKVFVCSMTDLFHEAIPFEYIAAAFGVMMATKQHTYQVLTKRPERAAAFFVWLWERANYEQLTESEVVEQLALEHLDVDVCHLQSDTSQWPLSNVWLGVSVENQEQADKRIPQLLQIPATIRFLSCEPLLGPLNLRAMPRSDGGRWDVLKGIDTAHACHLTGKVDWVICGGESGGRSARPMNPNWARLLRDSCAAAGVPFHFKQWGEWVPAGPIEADPEFYGGAAFDDPRGGRMAVGAIENRPSRFQRLDHDAVLVRVGKKLAGRLLDGIEHSEFPTTEGISI